LIKRKDTFKLRVTDYFIDMDSQNFNLINNNRKRLEDAVDLVISYFEKKYKRDLSDLLKYHYITNEFLTWPAAQKFHHAYKGGLVDHTLEVLQQTIKLCENHPEANIGIAALGAFVHDFAKIYEYKFVDNKWEKTDYYHQIGHIVGGAMYWRSVAEDCMLYGSIIYPVTHIILSHHGKLEWGSPVTPQTIESKIVHSADMWSANKK
jgi:3'-5' exoribonuclease